MFEQKYWDYLTYSFVLHFHENYSVLYKFPQYNTRLIVAEIFDYFLKNDNYVEGQLNVLLEEFYYITTVDPIFISGFYTALPLVSDIKKSHENKNIGKIKEYINTLNKEFSYNDKYLRKLQGFLASFLSPSHFKSDYTSYNANKKFFIEVLNVFIAELQSRYSRRYIEYLIERRLKSTTLDYSKKFETLSTLLLTQDANYDVTFKLTVYPDFKTERHDDGLIVLKKNLEESNSSFKLINFSDSEMEFELTISVSSSVHDNYIISQIAKKKITNIINAFLFEYNTFRVSISSEVSIQRCKDFKEWDKHSFIFNNIEYHVHPKKESIVEQLTQIVEKKVEVDSETLFRIENSLSYYNRSIHENEPDKKLLNLWIAIENLFRDLGNKNETITNIKNTICAISTIYYVQEHCDEFQKYFLDKSKDITEKGYSKNSYKDIIDIISSQNNDVFNSIGIFNFFTNPNNVREFDTQFSKIPMNYYYIDKYENFARKFQLSKTLKLVNLENSLDLNKKIVRWNLMRIYRKRNQIVHGHNVDDLRVDLKDLIIIEYYYHLILEKLTEFINAKHYKTNSMIEFMSKLRRTEEEYNKCLKKEFSKAENIVIPRIMI